MRYGPLIFLGLLLSLSLSWMGMIVTPQLQLGNAQPTNLPPANILYPTAPPGVANQGREVYRANGCASCHTQVIRQEGAEVQVVLTAPGTNATGVAEELVRVRKTFHQEIPLAEAQRLVGSAPQSVLTTTTGAAADSAKKALTAAGAQVSVRIVPQGPEIARGWGTRLSVATDYLYQQPLMLGAVRLGPDLTNIGLRRPDRIWHLVHLYDPKLETKGSTMPRYPFLFEKHKRGSKPSPNALPIAGEDEIIPTSEAEALVGYLMSLRTEMPLFEAPGPQLASAPSSGTNAPAGAPGSTNDVAAPSAPAPAAQQ